MRVPVDLHCANVLGLYGLDAIASAKRHFTIDEHWGFGEVVKALHSRESN